VRILPQTAPEAGRTGVFSFGSWFYWVENFFKGKNYFHNQRKIGKKSEP
jgi:hypothetical protein